MIYYFGSTVNEFYIREADRKMAETAERTTKVWAHRGASGYRPENTMEAFELAIKQGAGCNSIKHGYRR